MQFDIFGYRVSIEKVGMEAAQEQAAALVTVEDALEVLKSNGYSIEKNPVLQANALHAGSVKADRTLSKARAAVERLKAHGIENPSQNAIVRESGCSVNTIRKYRQNGLL
jgi:DNA invertase Pin-like site-specific DNA recombinase